MEKKFFTVDEVNQLLPQIKYHFRKLLEDKQEMGRASRRLMKLGLSPQGILSGEIPIDASPDALPLKDLLQEWP